MAFNLDVVGKTFGPRAFTYDWQRAALYALACGAATEDLDLLLETRGPKVLPSFSVLPAHASLVEALRALGGNMLTLVHGAQKCVAHRPIPPSGTLHATTSVTALYDKGKGALAVLETSTKDDSGALIAETECQIFFRGEGGFGGPRGPDAPAYAPPDGKAPDARVEMATSPAQALLYRLASEDLNPIHSDPDVARAAGFPKPILHGLCTFGHATKAAVSSLMGGDVGRLLSIEGRFSKPVFPGETIVTEMHSMAKGEAYFVVSAKERKEPVLTLGRVTYRP